MSNEAKCNCQRCGESIAFPVEMAGQDTACPHCGRETTLLVPQVRKANSDLSATALNGEPKSETPNATMVLLGIIGLVVIIIPVVLFIRHQAYVAECDRNFRELTEYKPAWNNYAQTNSENLTNKLDWELTH